MRSKGSHGVFAPSALRYPKISSRCSLARFFRPLRVLRLAASATGGARLRTPVPLPRCGGGASCPSVHFPKPSAFIMLSAVLPLSANFPLSPPPQRRGEGWWFALPRSSAGAIKMRRRHRWSASVRSTDLFFPIIEGKTIFVSSTAKRQRGLSRGNSSPLTRFCLLLAVQKEAPAGQAY